MRVIVNSVEMRERVIRKVRELPLDAPWEFTVEKWKPKRSAYQERKYRALVGDIAEAAGYDPIELHEVMLKRFAPREVKEIMGEEVEVVKRTGQMNEEEHEMFYKHVRQLAREYGVAS